MSPMRRCLSMLLSIMLVLALLSACATRIGDGARPLVFQQPGIAPGNGGELVDLASLQPGDIILSATNGVTSAGIRLLTLAPVSHAALYIGDQRIVEAVGAGIVTRSLDEMLAEESVVVAFRHPRLTSAQGERIGAFARSRVGGSYNHVGVVLMAPFALERRVCEVPLMPQFVREFCVRGVATIQLGASSNDRFFCSQFVLEAYRQAGLPITDADPRWISPADILHMREGDVPSVRVHDALLYLGHLKLAPPPRESNG